MPLLTYTGGKHDVILAFRESSTLITYATFQGSKQFRVTAISLSHSNATFEHCLFKRNDGALLLKRSKVLVSDSVFTENSGTVKRVGSVVKIEFGSELNVSKSLYIGNFATVHGGIRCSNSSIFMLFVDFKNNSANHRYYNGRTVVVKNGTAVFSNTAVTHNLGTALSFYQQSSIQFTGKNIFNQNVNTISAGGAIEADIMSNVSFSGVAYFEDNYALLEGGAISATQHTTIVFVGEIRFINNTSKNGFGGAVGIAIHSRLEMHGSVLFENNSCTNTYGGAVGAYDSSEIEIFDLATSS